MKKEDLEKELTIHVNKLVKIKEYCVNLKSAKDFDKDKAIDYILKIIMEVEDVN